MLLADALAEITNDPYYVPNSLVLKSYNDNGATYKWLIKINDELAERHERFFAFAPNQGSVELTQRLILEINSVPVIYDVSPAY